MSTLLAIFLSFADATAQECAEDALSAPRSSLSVAWVAPVGTRVGPKTRVEVVDTAALRRWLAEESGVTLGRLLQGMGLQATAEPPKTAWQVAIFEVESSRLCRPVLPGSDPGTLAGVALCSAKGNIAKTDGCGRLLDRADDTPSLPVFEVSWENAARAGFCILPAERFLVEGPAAR